MALLTSRSGALTVLLQWVCWHANTQRACSGPVASSFVAPVSLDAAAKGSWASSFEDRDTAERSSAVVVRYDVGVIDSHAKTAEKARELEVMPGVRNASALTCVGVVVVSCHSEKVQRRLLDDLTGDPHVEFAQHADSHMGHCSMPEIQFPANLRMVSAQTTTDNLTQAAQTTTDNLTQLSTEQEQEPAKFVGGHLTVSGLDLDVAREMPQAWQRLLAMSLSSQAWQRLLALSRSNTTQADIEIIRIVPFPASHQEYMTEAAAAHHSRHHIREKPRALRSRSVKVEFRVFSAAGSDPTFLDDVEAQVKLLHRSGRATERFDAALDSELQLQQVVLPDWARSRFSRPYRGPSIGTDGEASGDDSVVILLAFVGILVFFMVVFFMIMFFFTSPLGEWDGYP